MINKIDHRHIRNSTVLKYYYIFERNKSLITWTRNEFPTLSRYLSRTYYCDILAIELGITHNYISAILNFVSRHYERIKEIYELSEKGVFVDFEPKEQC